MEVFSPNQTFSSCESWDRLHYQHYVELSAANVAREKLRSAGLWSRVAHYVRVSEEGSNDKGGSLNQPFPSSLFSPLVVAGSSTAYHCGGPTFHHIHLNYPKKTFVDESLSDGQVRP